MSHCPHLGPIEKSSADPAQSTHQGSLCAGCGSSLQRPFAVSIKEFCRLVSVGKTTAWALARDGKIEVRHVRGRAVVLTRSIDSLLDLARQEGSACDAKPETR